MKTRFLGIDPGASGAVAALDESGTLETCKLNSTPLDIAEFIAAVDARFALLERVSAMPKQGVSSTFKFGTSFGMCIGLLTATRTPFELVTPTTWQTAMKCRSGGDKNVTKRTAQELFPDTKVTHATADAILLAEYCRRLWHERYR